MREQAFFSEVIPIEIQRCKHEVFTGIPVVPSTVDQQTIRLIQYGAIPYDAEMSVDKKVLNQRTSVFSSTFVTIRSLIRLNPYTTSSRLITSAYFIDMSKRFTWWEICDLSATHSTGIITL